MLRHFPKRIACDVGDDDRRSAICRRSTRAGTRSNWQLLHFLSPSIGKAGPRHRIQMTTIGTKQQNRSKRLRTVILDDQTQNIQDFVERNAGGDHLEETLFTREQCFASLALGNVYGGTNITVDFAGSPENGSTHTLDMLNRSVRKRDSKFHVKAAFLPNGFLKISLNKGSIFRMN